MGNSSSYAQKKKIWQQNLTISLWQYVNDRQKKNVKNGSK